MLNVLKNSPSLLRWQRKMDCIMAEILFLCHYYPVTTTQTRPAFFNVFEDRFICCICVLVSISEEFFYDISSHICTNIIFGWDWSKCLILFSSPSFFLSLVANMYYTQLVLCFSEYSTYTNVIVTKSIQK